MVIKRRLEHIVGESLAHNSTAAILGPRQVGKTTIALNIAEHVESVYLDLESLIDLEKVRDITAFHSDNRNRLIILDEVQRLPEVFTQLRGIIDKERRAGNKTGQFLFLGSASMALLQQSSESLAGRITYLELHPIDVLEYAQDSIDKMNTLWVRGGFPDSLLSFDDKRSLYWRRSFIKTYLERDIPQLGPRIPSETLERFWTMLAYNQGSMLNAAQLARSLEVAGVTIGRYLDLMVDLLLVRKVKPWTFNINKRLVRSPKVYVRDSGITHALLNIGTYSDLLGHPVVGGSWEGFVIENIMSVAPASAQPYFYRTSGGAEIDLILEFSPTERWAIEIKRNSTPSISSGFYIACEDVKPQRRYVVYSGKDRFPMGKDVTAISLAELMTEVLKQA
jgi:predicted AAA+ superfamily ATPase